jgi:hypothetical protein
LINDDSRQHRIVVRLLATLTVLVTALASIAGWQWNDATNERDRALSRELAARSETLGDSDPALSKLLSVAAWRISPTPEARAGMLRAAARPGITTIRTGTLVTGSPPRHCCRG